MTIKHRKKKTWVITLRRILKQITWIKYLRVWSGLKSRTEEISGHSSGIIISAAAAAKSLQSYPTLCDPTDSSPPGSSVPGILQARTLEWVAISFSNACQVASVVPDSVRPHGQQPTRLLCPQDSVAKNTGVGCHFLLQLYLYDQIYRVFTLA